MMQLESLPRSSTVSPSCTRVVLVRHGRSTFNEQGRYQGSSNASVLTQQGWQTAIQTGKMLQNIRFDAIYSSPLQRVQETIAAIQQGMQSSSADGLPDQLSSPRQEVPIYADSALREIDLPIWEGLPFAEVRQRFAIDYQRWKRQPHQFWMCRFEANQSESDQSGQSMPDDGFFPVLDLYDRASHFWQRILSRHRGQTLLIVAHGGTNHALLSTAIGLAPQHHHTLQQSNCGISVLEFPEHRSAQLRSLNSTHHLNEALPKLKEGKRGLRLLLLPLDPDANYPTAAIQSLAHQLQSTAIDLSVSATFLQARQAIDQMLQHHPNTLQFETVAVDFLQSWRHMIANRTADSDQLVTGLVVTNAQQIKLLIADAIGLSHDRAQSIYLRPGDLSILHYASMQYAPVLQSLNSNSVVSCFQDISV